MPPKLPKKILPFVSEDKNHLEKWYKGRDALDFPNARICLTGYPGSGKSRMLFNCLARSTFDQIVVWCYDKESKEFDSLNHIRVSPDTVPNMDLFSPEVKSCLIIDDINLTSLKKDDLKYVERLLGSVSTHRNVTIYILVQDILTSVPSCIRRNINVFFVFKGADLRSLNIINSRVGLKPGSLENIFRYIATNEGDSIRIDLTKNSPIPLGLNGYLPLQEIDYSK